ncbi:hypothetical protein HPB52_008889 [Rhipicephalus sanguineus]|uniref:Uncharacterized protein n=1 Tax=Rhipicephalus sanguineus TaxID=34632 RepID=A0A9D4PZ25_RHISA|nr:hypothetical protein HPB52_008889 [Rhipicephalus sanguineus]
MTDPGMIEEGAPEHLELNSISSTSVCLADLDGVKGPFSGAPLPYKLPCRADKDRTCQIVRHLSTWNEFLFQVRMEIREVAGARGQLAVMCFDSLELLIDDGDSQLHRIATLLHWLLSTHHCIRSFSARPTRFKSYKWLFREALLKSSSIEYLKLHFTSFQVCKDVCKVVAAAHHVKELELQSHEPTSAEVVSALLTLLKATNTLVVLKIPHVSKSGPDADQFLTLLAENNTLRELSVHESAFCEASVASRTRFADHPKSKCTLTTLAVGKGDEVWYQLSPVPTTLFMTWILQGLLTNSTVSSLKLMYVVVDRESVRLLCALFKESKVLRKFSLTSSLTDLRAQPRSAYDCWTEALAENESLQELTLPFGIWEVGSWKAFFNIMSRKRNLASVTINIYKVDYPGLRETCECVRESGVDSRVSFGTYYPSDSFDLLESTVFTEVSVVSFRDFTNVLRLLRQLPSYPHITSLMLDICAGDTTLSCAFADYMESSSTLRKLRLWLGSDGFRQHANGWRTDIFASLSRNNSIRELYMKSMHMYEQDVCLLADLVTSSRTIEKVRFGTATPAESGALVRLLSLGIATNYTLLNVSFEGPVDREAAKHMFILCDVARRNSDLVALAAHRCAQALERVSSHPALPELLSKLTSVSTAEAAAKVRSCLGSIEGMEQFMRLAGVVNEGVARSTREDGGTHLAGLNEHCWSHIRRYLKLYDVLCDDTGPHEAQGQ